MRIAQISDFHFTRLTWNPLKLMSKRLIGNLNWMLTRKGAFSEKQLKGLPALFESLGVEKILFGGDFTTTSLEAEFEAAASFLKECKQPWLAVPGNHDCYTKESEQAQIFYDYFANPKSPLPFSLKTHDVEIQPLCKGWWALLLDTTRATHPLSSKGLFSHKLEESVRKILNLIPETDSILLFNHYPFFRNDHPSRQLQRGDVLEKILKEDKRIRAYLHGHTHRHTVADLQPSDLPLVLDSGCVASRGGGTWNLINLTDEGCDIQGYRYRGEWAPFKQARVLWKRK